MTRLPGMVLMGLSALCFALMAASIKILLRGGVPAGEIIFVRGVLCTAWTIAALRLAGAPVFGKRRGLLAVRGVLGFCGLLLYTLALGRIPLPDAMTLQYTHPIFAATFAGLFLAERMPKSTGWAMLVCAAGAVTILDPTGTGDRTGYLIALGSGIASGAAYAAVRALHKTESSMTIMLAFHLATLVFGAVMLSGGGILPDAAQVWWLLVVVVFSQGGQWFLTHGLRKEQAGVATTVSYTAIAWGALLSWLLFDEPIGLRVAGGAVLLVLGLMLLARSRRTPGASLRTQIS